MLLKLSSNIRPVLVFVLTIRRGIKEDYSWIVNGNVSEKGCKDLNSMTQVEKIHYAEKLKADRKRERKKKNRSY